MKQLLKLLSGVGTVLETPILTRLLFYLPGPELAGSRMARMKWNKVNDGERKASCADPLCAAGYTEIRLIW